MIPYTYSRASAPARAAPVASFARHFYIVLLAWTAVALLPSAAFGQSCTFYLNATDGNDANSGTSPALAVRSFEYAFRTFPSDAVVCMTGGEYFHSLDADGIQLTGPDVAGKNMQFVLQNFAGAAEVSFSEDELRVDIGSGRVSFAAGSARSLRIGRGVVNVPAVYPANTTFLHSIVLGSGTIDLSDVDVTIEASVGNPEFVRADDSSFAAPDTAAIVRETGTLIGAPAFEEAARSVRYIGSGDRSAGNEVPPLVSRLNFRHMDGTVTVSQPLAFAEGALIDLTGAGTARILTPVSIAQATSPSFIVTGGGELDVSGPALVGVTQDIPLLAHLASNGRLTLRDLTVTGTGLSDQVAVSLTNSGSGMLTVHRASADSNVKLSVHNENGGECRLGTTSSSTVIDTDLRNDSNGDCVFQGGVTLLGSIENEGHLTVERPTELSASLDNTGTVELQADLAISGLLLNSGDLDIGPYALTISGAGPHRVDGRVRSLGGSGSLVLTASTSLSGDGELPRIVSVAGTHSVRATRVMAVVIKSGARLGLSAAEIEGALSLEGGAGMIGVGSAGALELRSGSLILEDDLSVDQYVQESSASIDLASHMLTVDGSFERLGGPFTSGDGIVRFAGAPIQSFHPGPNLTLDNLQLDGTDVRLESGPLDVRDSLIVVAGSKLLLSDHVVRMVEPHSVVRNDGEISTSITGALTFGGPPGAEQKLSGNGLFGNVEIALQNEDGVVLGVEADLRQGGILTLSSGRFRLSPGSRYSLVSTLGVPLIRRNLGDADGDGEPEGKPIDANTADTGAFLSPEEGYNLEYFGTIDGAAATGAEFVSGRIVDLRIQIDGPDGGTAALSLSGDLSFTGELDLAESAVLDVGGFDLAAVGSGRRHEIGGRIEGNGGALVLSGSSVTLAGEAEAPSEIVNMRVEAEGSVDLTGIRAITGVLEVNSGQIGVNLAAADSVGTVGDLIVRGGGQVVLESNMGIGENVRMLGGELNLGEFDLVMAAGSSFDAESAATIGSGDKGSVAFTGHGTLSTGGTVLPRLRVTLPAESVLSIAGDVRIGASLMIESGSVDLSTGTLTLESGRWDVLGGRISGDGAVVIDGVVEGTVETDFIVPRLIVRGPDPTGGLSFGPLSSGRVFVSDTLSLQAGLLDLGLTDLVVGSPGAQAVLETSGGAVAMTSGPSIADSAGGELVLSDAKLALHESFNVANVRIAGAARFASGSAPLVIRKQITFADGMLENADSTRVRLMHDARIVRRGSGTFRQPPIAEGALELFYDIRGAVLDGGVLLTGSEIPPDGRVRRLIVDAGNNVVRLLRNVHVADTLRLDSGTLDRFGFDLRLNAGATVHYDHSASPPPSFAGGSFQPDGPVRLVYSGTTSIESDDLTFPSTANVSQLVVEMGGRDDEDALFVLHGNRRVQSMLVAGTNAGSGADLNGRTLIVNAEVNVLSGVVSSTSEAILDVGDSLVIAEDGAVRGVVGALVRGHVDIGGVFDGYLLRTHSDVNISGELGSMEGEPTASAAGNVEGLPNLEFAGTDQVIRLRRGDDSTRTIDEFVNRFVMASGGRVRLEGPDASSVTLAVNNLDLRSGLLETDGIDIRLPHDGAGFQRPEPSSSHVVGRISRRLRVGQTGRFDFPLGSGGDDARFRPVSLTFTEDDPLAVTTVVTVGHTNAAPGGYLGLPIDGGDEILIGDVSGFHWTMDAAPAVPPSQSYSLGVIGSGFTSFAAARTLRLVRRSMGEASEHSWEIEASPEQYNNAVVTLGDQTVPFVQVVESNQGIPAEPELFAIGIEASEIDFARVQVVNLMGRTEAITDVFVDDSSAASGLAFGEATPYVRLDSGRTSIRLQDAGGARIVNGTLAFEAGRDYLLAAVDPTDAGAPRLILREAKAIPEADAVDDVSLGFFHGIPDGPSLSLRTRDDPETLFTGVAFGHAGNTLAPLPSQNTGFDVVVSPSSVALLSMRSELDGHAGETVHAFAGGYLDPASYGASAAAQVFLISNHGHLLKTGVQVATEEPEELPEAFVLYGNYPNPFNPSTNVVVDLPESADVTVEVFDLLGRSVMRVRGGMMAPGRRTLAIDASALPSGVYVYRITASGSRSNVDSGTMTLVR